MLSLFFLYQKNCSLETQINLCFHLIRFFKWCAIIQLWCIGALVKWLLLLHSFIHQILYYSVSLCPFPFFFPTFSAPFCLCAFAIVFLSECVFNVYLCIFEFSECPDDICVSVCCKLVLYLYPSLLVSVILVELSTSCKFDYYCFLLLCRK